MSQLLWAIDPVYCQGSQSCLPGWVEVKSPSQGWGRMWFSVSWHHPRVTWGQAQWGTRGAKEPATYLLKAPDLISRCATATTGKDRKRKTKYMLVNTAPHWSQPSILLKLLELSWAWFWSLPVKAYPNKPWRITNKHSSFLEESGNPIAWMQAIWCQQVEV